MRLSTECTQGITLALPVPLRSNRIKVCSCAPRHYSGLAPSVVVCIHARLIWLRTNGTLSRSYYSVMALVFLSTMLSLTGVEPVSRTRPAMGTSRVLLVPYDLAKV